MGEDQKVHSKPSLLYRGTNPIPSHQVNLLVLPHTAPKKIPLNTFNPFGNIEIFAICREGSEFEN
jgi:hypothetical protein